MEEDREASTSATDPIVLPAPRNPRKRFVGRRTAEAQAKDRSEISGSIEGTTDALQKGKASPNVPVLHEQWLTNTKRLDGARHE